MGAPITISVVLPTYNRRARLERALNALERQTLPSERFEVIVVDDGSTDDTAAWLSRANHGKLAIVAVRQENGGPARARNTGVGKARGELILFIDDDVEATPELLAEHVRSHEAEPNAVVIGPLASLDHYAQPWVAWEQAKLELQYQAMLRGDWAPTFRQFWTGNASVARQAILDAGGFDSSFLRAEDIELGRRLHERGLVFRFNPRARGLHHAERSLRAWEAMHKSYGMLEVKIFGGLGEEQLVDVLARNFSRIHPATRWLVGQCVGNPRRHAAACRVLRGVLELEARVQVPVASEQVCGALANLIYWEASAQTLGAEPIQQIFRRGDELRQSARA